MRLIGVLMAYGEVDLEGQQRLEALRQSLANSGWIEGQNARIEVRWLAGDPERAKVYAKELIERSPDVIIVNGTPGLAAATDTHGPCYICDGHGPGWGWVRQKPIETGWQYHRFQHIRAGNRGQMG